MEPYRQGSLLAPQPLNCQLSTEKGGGGLWRRVNAKTRECYNNMKNINLSKYPNCESKCIKYMYENVHIC